MSKGKKNCLQNYDWETPNGEDYMDSSLDERKVLSNPNRINFEGMKYIKLGYFLLQVND